MYIHVYIAKKNVNIIVVWVNQDERVQIVDIFNIEWLQLYT